MPKAIGNSQANEIRLLSANQYSLAAIAKMLKLSKSTVYYYAKHTCSKMSKFSVELLDDFERGYIIGIFLGDGSFNRGLKEERFFVRFALDGKRDKDIALNLQKIMGKAGKKMSLIPSKTNIIAKTCSKELVSFIQRYVEYSQNGKSIRLFKSDSNEFKFGFLAGLIDSDGHVHGHLGTEIKTVSNQIMIRVTEILGELGISSKTTLRNAPAKSFSKKSRFEIYICSSEIKRNRSLIPSVKVSRYQPPQLAPAEKD